MNSGLLLPCALGLFLISTTALAGPNPNFRLPLHVVESFWAPCEDYLPVDCLGTRPATAAIPNHPAVIYLLVFNHTGIAGLQAGLEWDPSWTWSFALFDCLPGQLEGIFPDGPTTASGSTAFNCLQGPALAAIGRITFQVGHSGCLKFRQPAYTLGIAALACTSQEVDQITDADSPRLGRVCVGSGGHDPCDAAVPVEPSTWGEIKSTFR
jgi:hypothetical protein